MTPATHTAQHRETATYNHELALRFTLDTLSITHLAALLKPHITIPVIASGYPKTKCKVRSFIV